MGIPYFYGAIIRKNNNIISDNVPDCCRLFLDYNSIIHQCVNVLKQKNVKPLTNDIIFNCIVDYTEIILQYVRPTELAYIAIDGIAPLAKQIQQRKRRYLSAHMNEEMENFKKNHNIPFVSWDSNQITPGTNFMNNLNEFLRNYFVDGKKRHYRVIVSGSDDIGEGEHKAIEFIKNYPSPPGMNDIIYGLDADLIMLSLISEKDEIYLMRESSDFDSSRNSSNGFKFLNIAILRTCISKYLVSAPMHPQASQASQARSYMNDYVILCFFLGNDFLPNIAALKIKFNAIDILCNAYRKIHSKIGQTLLTSKNHFYKINFSFLTSMIEELYKSEDSLLANITNEYDKIELRKNNNKFTPLDKFVFEMDTYPLKNKMTHLINPINKTWRTDYYHYLFDDHSASCIKSSCLSYIKGMVWNVNYYFNKKYSMLWYYPYNYAPTLFDIHKYLTTMTSQNFDSLCSLLDREDNVVMSTDHQLLMVLPPQSIEILKPELRPIMKDIRMGTVHYYPKIFKKSTYLKNHGWEVVPLLPTIHFSHISEVLKTLIRDVVVRP